MVTDPARFQPAALSTDRHHQLVGNRSATFGGTKPGTSTTPTIDLGAAVVGPAVSKEARNGARHVVPSCRATRLSCPGGVFTEQDDQVARPRAVGGQSASSARARLRTRPGSPAWHHVAHAVALDRTAPAGNGRPPCPFDDVTGLPRRNARGQIVDEVRHRVQQTIHGHRGRKDDPLYQNRNLLRCAEGRLTERQHRGGVCRSGCSVADATASRVWSTAPQPRTATRLNAVRGHRDAGANHCERRARSALATTITWCIWT